MTEKKTRKNNGENTRDFSFGYAVTTDTDMIRWWSNKWSYKKFISHIKLYHYSNLRMIIKCEMKWQSCR